MPWQHPAWYSISVMIPPVSILLCIISQPLSMFCGTSPSQLWKMSHETESKTLLSMTSPHGKSIAAEDKKQHMSHRSVILSTVHPSWNLHIQTKCNQDRQVVDTHIFTACCHTEEWALLPGNSLEG